MVDVTLESNKICMEGHAGQSVNGQDIVCSAISALTCTLINSLQMMANIDLDYELKDGFTCISWGHPLNETGKILLESFIIGLNGINEEYNCITFN